MGKNIKDLSKLEKALLDRELAQVQASLAKIGQDLISVFEKYGTIKGQCGNELADYVRGGIVAGVEHYYSGHTTTAAIVTNPAALPEQVRTAILDWAVKDFFEKFEAVQGIVEDINQ